MHSPLVTVICLVHNQLPYLEEAITSVLNQDYPYVELIVVDDGSTDGSKESIRDLIKSVEFQFVDIPASVGNCTAFNRGLDIATGDFIIDLAADDVLHKNRVTVGVERLQETGYGVHYSNAELIAANGDHLALHNDRFDHKMPEGDIYSRLVRGYLVCPTTMMIKREVFDELEGYDESLSYEDFDFWVRSSRVFPYCYSDQVLVKKRILKGSHAATHAKFRNRHQRTTLEVCRKILNLNKTMEDRKALKIRCWHEIRECIKKGNLELLPDYLSILKRC